jgi:hypothetical protein
MSRIKNTNISKSISMNIALSRYAGILLLMMVSTMTSGHGAASNPIDLSTSITSIEIYEQDGTTITVNEDFIVGPGQTIIVNKEHEGPDGTASWVTIDPEDSPSIIDYEDGNETGKSVSNFGSFSIEREDISNEEFELDVNCIFAGVHAFAGEIAMEVVAIDTVEVTGISEHKDYVVLGSKAEGTFTVKATLDGSDFPTLGDPIFEFAWSDSESADGEWEELDESISHPEKNSAEISWTPEKCGFYRFRVRCTSSDEVGVESDEDVYYVAFPSITGMSLTYDAGSHTSDLMNSEEMGVFWEAPDKGMTAQATFDPAETNGTEDRICYTLTYGNAIPADGSFDSSGEATFDLVAVEGSYEDHFSWDYDDDGDGVVDAEDEEENYGYVWIPDVVSLTVTDKTEGAGDTATDPDDHDVELEVNTGIADFEIEGDWGSEPQSTVDYLGKHVYYVIYDKDDREVLTSFGDLDLHADESGFNMKNGPYTIKIRYDFDYDGRTTDADDYYEISTISYSDIKVTDTNNRQVNDAGNMKVVPETLFGETITLEFTDPELAPAEDDCVWEVTDISTGSTTEYIGRKVEFTAECDLEEVPGISFWGLDWVWPEEKNRKTYEITIDIGRDEPLTAEVVTYRGDKSQIKYVFEDKRFLKDQTGNSPFMQAAAATFEAIEVFSDPLQWVYNFGGLDPRKPYKKPELKFPICSWSLVSAYKEAEYDAETVYRDWDFYLNLVAKNKIEKNFYFIIPPIPPPVAYAYVRPQAEVECWAGGTFGCFDEKATGEGIQGGGKVRGGLSLGVDILSGFASIEGGGHVGASFSANALLNNANLHESNSRWYANAGETIAQYKIQLIWGIYDQTESATLIKGWTFSSDGPLDPGLGSTGVDP